MKLVNYDLGLEIELIENVVCVLIIENPSILNNIICDIKTQLSGESGQFVLSDDSILNMEKSLELIIDPWNIDFNSRKIRTKLQNIIIKTIDELFFDKMIDIKNDLYYFSEKIIDELPYSIDYNTELCSNDFVKFIDFSIHTDTMTTIESIVEYIKLMKSICNVDIYMFVNLKSYITKEEILLFYKEIEYLKVYVILLETHFIEKIENEKVLIIDKDVCIIEL